MGLGFPSVSIPSPKDVFNGAKDKVDDLADSGKRRASDLREDVSNVTDRARDRTGGFIDSQVDRGRDFVSDKVDNGRDFVSDKVDNGRDFVSDKYDDGRDFVSDKVDNGRDFVSDKVDDGRDFVSDQIDNGNAVVDRVKEEAGKVTDFIRENASITPEDVHDLQPGDSVSLDAKAEGGEGVIVGAELDIAVSLDEDGVYTVSQEASVKVGTGVKKDAAEVGGQLGGAREFKFDNPEDAARAADILQKQSLAASTNPVAIALSADYIVSGDARRDQKWLDQHTSKLEAGPGVYVKTGVPKTGLELDGLSERFDQESDGAGALGGVEVELSGDTTYAIEYENGVSKSIVETANITLSGSLDAENSQVNGLVPDLEIPGSGIELEQLLEVDGELSVQLEKRTSVETGEVEYTIRLNAEADLQDDRGYSAELSGTISEDQIDDVIRDLANGDVDGIVDSVSLAGESYETDIDRTGFDLGFVVGEVGVGKEYRDIDEDSRMSVQVG